MPRLRLDAAGIVVFPAHRQHLLHAAAHLAGNRALQGVVGVEIGDVIRGRFRSGIVADGIELAVAVVGIGQSAAAGIAGRARPAEAVIGKGDLLTIAVDLLHELAVLGGILVACQQQAADAHRRQVAEGVVIAGNALPGLVRRARNVR